MRGLGQDGTAVIGLLAPLLAGLVVAVVVVVDVGAFLVASRRAQALADGAVLAAAVAADRWRDPRAAAIRVLEAAADGELVDCTCPRGHGADVEVTVRVPVPGLVVPHVWASSVDATARATTVVADG